MFNDFIGNEKAKNVINIGICAAIRKNDRIPHYIFSGAAGNGKTKMAKDIVKETGAVSVYLNASTITNTESVVQSLDMLFEEYNKKNARHAIVIVDEAHSLKGGKICDFFLTAISEDTVEVKCGKTTRSLPIMRTKSGRNDFLSWIFITNRTGELADALISRLTEVRFVDYSEDEKCEIAKRYFEHLDSEIRPEICTEVGKRAWSAREVIKYVEGINDYAIFKDLDEDISIENVNEYFELIGVDSRGLGIAELEYIEILKNSPNGISLQNIATKMGIGVKDISEMIEKKLVRLNIVSIESNGRSLVDRSTLSNRFSIEEQ